MKARLSYLLALLAVLALALAGCGGAAQETTPTEAAAEAAATEAPAVAESTVAPTEAAAEGAPTEAPVVVTGNTLDAVRERGTLRCAGNQSVPGFGYINPDTNEFEGFDIDFCKVFAVAVSYTHLDVYKRQVPTHRRSAAPRPRPGPRTRPASDRPGKRRRSARAPATRPRRPDWW